MRCFVHHDQEAVGTCRACGKGLCPDCAVELGYAICCHGACEQEARENHALNVRSRTILNAQKRNRFFGPAFIIFMGVVFLGAGLSWRGGLLNFATVSGAGFIAFGIIMYLLNRRVYKKMEDNLAP